MQPEKEVIKKVRANGREVSYQIQGNGDNLLLIHGVGDNLNMWYQQVPVFMKSYRVITYDLRGAGNSETSGEGGSVPNLTEDAYQLMESLGIEKVFIVGFSIGSIIGVYLALYHPRMVKGLVIANISAGLAPLSRRVQKRRLENLKSLLTLLDEGDMGKSAEFMTLGAFSPGFGDKNPAVFNDYKKIKMQNSPEGVAGLIRSLSTLPPPPDPKGLKCPVLVIAGKNDLYGGLTQGKLVHEAIAGSELVILPTGHAAPVESPEEFNSAVLGFLSRIKSE